MGDWEQQQSPTWRMYKHGAGHPEKDMFMKKMEDPWGAPEEFDDMHTNSLELDPFSYQMDTRELSPSSPQRNMFDESWSAFAPSPYMEMEGDMKRLDYDLYYKNEHMFEGHKNWQFGRAALGLEGDYRPRIWGFEPPPFTYFSSTTWEHMLHGAFVCSMVYAWYTTPSDGGLVTSASRWFEIDRELRQDEIAKRAQKRLRRARKGKSPQHSVKDVPLMTEEEKEAYTRNSLIALMMDNADQFFKSTYVLDLQVVKLATLTRIDSQRFFWLGALHNWIPLPTPSFLQLLFGIGIRLVKKKVAPLLQLV